MKRRRRADKHKDETNKVQEKSPGRNTKKEVEKTLEKKPKNSTNTTKTFTKTPYLALNHECDESRRLSMGSKE